MTRKRLHTLLCDLLGIEYPIVQAPMGAMMHSQRSDAAHGELAAAVSAAGGLGVIGAAGMSPDQIRDEVRKVKERTAKPFGVGLILTPMTAGTVAELKAQLPRDLVALVDRLRQELGIPQAQAPEQWVAGNRVEEQIEVVFSEGVPVLVIGLGNPQPIAAEAHRRGIKIISLVGNVRNARRVAAGGADIVGAQGYDAGGHTGRIGTLALVPQVVDAVSPTPVIAAGGIGDGRGLVAALALGAVGVLCGTAFLVSKESNAHELWKRMIVEATDEDTRLTKMYTGKQARVLINPLLEAWERAEASALPYPLQAALMVDLMQGAKDSGRGEIHPFAGQVSGLLREVKSAREILEGMVAQAIAVLGEEFPAKIDLKG